jgi:hypothetical protein
VGSLLATVIQIILIEMDFASKIIQTIKDALRVTENLIGIIKEHFKDLKEALLSISFYSILGFALQLATLVWVPGSLISQPFLAY